MLKKLYDIGVIKCESNYAFSGVDKLLIPDLNAFIVALIEGLDDIFAQLSFLRDERENVTAQINRVISILKDLTNLLPPDDLAKIKTIYNFTDSYISKDTAVPKPRPAYYSKPIIKFTYPDLVPIPPILQTIPRIASTPMSSTIQPDRSLSNFSTFSTAGTGESKLPAAPPSLSPAKKPLI